MLIEPRRRDPRTRRLPVVIAAILAALALAVPGTALASHSQEMILQDDQSLVYASPSQVADTLSKIKAMGVDRVRVSVVWSLVAPRASASRKPKFNAIDPAAYPPGAWYRYDFIDLVAHRLDNLAQSFFDQRVFGSLAVFVNQCDFHRNNLLLFHSI